MMKTTNFLCAAYLFGGVEGVKIGLKPNGRGRPSHVSADPSVLGERLSRGGLSGKSSSHRDEKSNPLDQRMTDKYDKNRSFSRQAAQNLQDAQMRRKSVTHTPKEKSFEQLQEEIKTYRVAGYTVKTGLLGWSAKQYNRDDPLKAAKEEHKDLQELYYKQNPHLKVEWDEQDLTILNDVPATSDKGRNPYSPEAVEEEIERLKKRVKLSSDQNEFLEDIKNSKQQKHLHLLCKLQSYRRAEEFHAAAERAKHEAEQFEKQHEALSRAEKKEIEAQVAKMKAALKDIRDILQFNSDLVKYQLRLKEMQRKASLKYEEVQQMIKDPRHKFPNGQDKHVIEFLFSMYRSDSELFPTDCIADNLQERLFEEYYTNHPEFEVKNQDGQRCIWKGSDLARLQQNQDVVRVVREVYSEFPESIPDIQDQYHMLVFAEYFQTAIVKLQEAGVGYEPNELREKVWKYNPEKRMPDTLLDMVKAKVKQDSDRKDADTRAEQEQQAKNRITIELSEAGEPVNGVRFHDMTISNGNEKVRRKVRYHHLSKFANDHGVWDQFTTGYNWLQGMSCFRSARKNNLVAWAESLDFQARKDLFNFVRQIEVSDDFLIWEGNVAPMVEVEYRGAHEMRQVGPKQSDGHAYKLKGRFLPLHARDFINLEHNIYVAHHDAVALVEMMESYNPAKAAQAGGFLGGGGIQGTWLGQVTGFDGKTVDMERHDAIRLILEEILENRHRLTSHDDRSSRKSASFSSASGSDFLLQNLTHSPTELNDLRQFLSVQNLLESTDRVGA